MGTENSLDETDDLMRSSCNADRLIDAIERLESGQGKAQRLIDESLSEVKNTDPAG